MADEMSFTDAANTDNPDALPQSEIDEAEKWKKKIAEARKFDENARRDYARDRQYARNDTNGYEVDVPIAPSYIDIKAAFLYARNPDLDIQPAPATDPPPMADIIEMAREQIAKDPATHQMMEQVGVQTEQAAAIADQQALQNAPQTAVGDAPSNKNIQPVAPPPLPPGAAGEAAAQAWLNATIKQKGKEIMAPYRERQNQAKQFGKTLEVVIERAWAKGRLKPAVDKMVRSSISTGPGWLKITWQERQGWDPTTETAQRDAVAQAERIALLEQQISDNDVQDDDVAKAELAELKESMQANLEVLVDKGMVFDFVRAEDIQVSASVSKLMDYLDSPWIDHRTYMLKDEAAAKYPKIANRIKSASMYFLKKKEGDDNNRLEAPEEGFDPREADAYRVAGASLDTGNMPAHVCIHETWDAVAHVMRTSIEGLKGWACDPVPPDPGTSRFYPFFYLGLLEVDGERHPASFIGRSRKMLDEVNRQYSALAEHRRRSLPKTAFNAGDLDKTEVEKIEKGGIQEMIGLKPTNPEQALSNILFPLAYAKIDMALYDPAVSKQYLEIVWSIQEALAAASNPTEKTATEAEIQQSGTATRTAHERAAIDTVMNDIAHYCAEVLIQKVQPDEVKEIAGPWAFWPTGITMKDMSLLITVAIKGGSTGKPDTAREQQAWAVQMPILEKLIMQIAQLRQSSPEDVGDCLEELASEMFRRAGERLDPTRFIPQTPSRDPGQQPGNGPAPQAAPQPQVSPQMVSKVGPTPRPIHMPPPAPNPQAVPIPHHGHANVPLPGQMN